MKTKYPDRLPNEGEIFNGWEISVSKECSIQTDDGEQVPADVLEYVINTTAFRCRKNQRVVIFVITDELLDMARSGSVAAIQLFWSMFEDSTKHKKTVRQLKEK